MRALAIAVVVSALLVGAGCTPKPVPCLVLRGPSGSPEDSARRAVAAFQAKDVEQLWPIFSARFRDQLVFVVSTLQQGDGRMTRAVAKGMRLTVSEFRAMPPVSAAKGFFVVLMEKQKAERACATKMTRESTGSQVLEITDGNGEIQRWKVVLELGVWHVDPWLDFD